MIEITSTLAIPDDEVHFETSRAGGPGGQNVNKVETRVALLFDLAGSVALSDEDKVKVRERLASRVSHAGVLRVVCQVHRSQGANREEVVMRFAALLRTALSDDAPRVPTRVPRGARQRRLDAKRRDGQRKALRTARITTDD